MFDWKALKLNPPGLPVTDGFTNTGFSEGPFTGDQFWTPTPAAYESPLGGPVGTWKTWVVPSYHQFVDTIPPPSPYGSPAFLDQWPEVVDVVHEALLSRAAHLLRRRMVALRDLGTRPVEVKTAPAACAVSLPVYRTIVTDAVNIIAEIIMNDICLFIRKLVFIDRDKSSSPRESPHDISFNQCMYI